MENNYTDNEDMIFYKGKSDITQLKETMKRLEMIHNENIKKLKSEGQLIEF